MGSRYKLWIFIASLIVLVCTGCYADKRDTISDKYSDKKITKIVKEYLHDKYGKELDIDVKSIEKYETSHTIIDATKVDVFRGFVADCGDYLVFVDFPEEHEEIANYISKDYILYDTKQSNEIINALQERFDKALEDLDGVGGSVNFHYIDKGDYEYNSIRFWRAFHTKFNGDLEEFSKVEYDSTRTSLSLTAILGNCGNTDLQELEKVLHDKFLVSNSTVICHITDSNIDEIKEADLNSGGFETTNLKNFMYAKYNNKFIDILNINNMEGN